MGWNWLSGGCSKRGLAVALRGLWGSTQSAPILSHQVCLLVEGAATQAPGCMATSACPQHPASYPSQESRRVPGVKSNRSPAPKTPGEGTEVSVSDALAGGPPALIDHVTLLLKPLQRLLDALRRKCSLLPMASPQDTAPLPPCPVQPLWPPSRSVSYQPLPTSAPLPLLFPPPRTPPSPTLHAAARRSPLSPTTLPKARFSCQPLPNTEDLAQALLLSLIGLLTVFLIFLPY